MPLCLYGSENCLLTNSLLLTLEAFKDKIAEEALALWQFMPTHFLSVVIYNIIEKYDGCLGPSISIKLSAISIQHPFPYLTYAHAYTQRHEFLM